MNNQARDIDDESSANVETVDDISTGGWMVQLFAQPSGRILFGGQTPHPQYDSCGEHGT